MRLLRNPVCAENADLAVTESLACFCIRACKGAKKSEFGEILLMQYSTIQEQGTRRRPL